MKNESEHQAELGYWIGKPFWNRGFCTEAGGEVLKYAFLGLKLARVHEKLKEALGRPRAFGLPREDLKVRWTTASRESSSRPSKERPRRRLRDRRGRLTAEVDRISRPARGSRTPVKAHGQPTPPRHVQDEAVRSQQACGASATRRYFRRSDILLCWMPFRTISTLALAPFMCERGKHRWFPCFNGAYTRIGNPDANHVSTDMALHYAREDVAREYASADNLIGPEHAILEQLRPRLADSRMLDVGVGGGRTTPHFAPLVREYVGIDFSPAMIEACRQRFPHGPGGSISFQIADAQALTGFPDESFDFVLFSLNGLDVVGEHEDRLRALREIHRVCRTGGVFCFCSSNFAWAESFYSMRGIGREFVALLRSGFARKPRALRARLASLFEWRRRKPFVAGAQASGVRRPGGQALSVGISPRLLHHSQ